MLPKWKAGNQTSAAVKTVLVCYLTQEDLFYKNYSKKEDIDEILFYLVLLNEYKIDVF